MNISDIGSMSPEAILAMFQDELQTQRGDAREAAEAAHQAQQSSLSERIDNLRDQATWSLVGSIVQGGAGIAAGAVTIDGNASALSRLQNSSTPTNPAAQTPNDTRLQQELTALNGRTAGWSSLTQSSGQLLGGICNYIAQGEGRDAEDAQRRAQDAEHRTRSAQELAQAARDMANQVNSRIDALENARHAINTLWRA
jgi:hypothetical protein